MSRRSRKPIGDATPQPLAIIAGIPSPNHSAVMKEVQSTFPHWKVIATPFPRDPRAPYTDSGAILDLVRAVCLFAEGEVEKQPPRPGQLVLLYVKEDGFRRLIDVFGFSALALPLRCDNWNWPNGKHWRADPEIVSQLVKNAISEIEDGAYAALKLRLEKCETDDCLLLPPRNFQLSDGHTLFKRFDEGHLNSCLHLIDDSDINVDVFTAENLKTFFVKTHEFRRSFRIDSRGLVFAISRRGQHGPSRMQDVSKTQTLEGFRPLLEGLYRFGTPLRSGFQHDVQWPKDRPLVKVEFVNIDEPIVLENQSHANIYANDSVR